MSDHEKHGHHKGHQTHAKDERPWWRRAHKDWRMWVAVVLMLLGMAAYLMSFDESLRPGGKVTNPVPAAPG